MSLRVSVEEPCHLQIDVGTDIGSSGGSSSIFLYGEAVGFCFQFPGDVQVHSSGCLPASSYVNKYVA
jgi:hypothetical protein